MIYKLVQSTMDCSACEEDEDNLVRGNKREKTSIFDRTLDDFYQPTKGNQ
jgi:hypothetical protein